MDRALLEQKWPEIRRRMEEGGTDAVLAYTAAYPEPDEMELDATAAQKFYFQEWQGKSLDRYADSAEAVIEKYLARAESAEDGARAARLWQFANAASFNLSANLAECWPDEQIVKERRHFERGLAAAERCLDLRRRLGKDDLSLARAH